MKRSALVVGLVLAATLLAVLSASKPVSLLVATWIDGKQQQMDGARIELCCMEFFYPGNTSTHVLIGQVLSPRSIVEIEKQELSAADRHKVTAFECTVLRCKSHERTTESFNGITIEIDRQSYHREGASYLQTRYWLNGNYSVRFNGPASEFDQSKKMIDRLLGQLLGVSPAK